MNTEALTYKKLFGGTEMLTELWCVKLKVVMYSS